MKRIVAITLVVPDLATVLAVYQSFGYPLVSQGQLTQDDVIVQRDARFLSCAFACLTLNPGIEQHLELVEYPECPQRVPFSVSGWAALELLVADLNAVYEQVRSMGLPIWGEPKPLSFTDDIKAMQVLGRAGELIYFTQQISPVPAWPLPQVRQPYDQCFVAILCSHQIAVSNTFYARLFETPEPEILRSKVAGLSRLGGLSSDALHSISALAMGCGHWLEIDQGLSDLSIELGGIQAGIYSISIHSDTVISFARGFGVAVKSSINTSCHFLSGPSGEKINWYQEQGV